MVGEGGRWLPPPGQGGELVFGEFPWLKPWALCPVPFRDPECAVPFREPECAVPFREPEGPVPYRDPPEEVGGSGAGMELFVDFVETLLVDVGVDLGGGDVGVSEEFLDDAEVGTAFEEVGGEGVAEEVGVNVLFDAGVGGALFDDLADAVGAEGAAADGEKDLGGGFFFRAEEVGALVVEVVADGFEGPAADGDDAGLVAFAGDADESVVEVEGFEADFADFGEAEAGGVEEFEDGEVAAAEGDGGVDGVEEGDDVLGVEGFGEVGGGAGGEERFGGIGVEVAAVDEEAEEDLEVDDADALGGGFEAAGFLIGEEVGEFQEAEVAPGVVAVFGGPSGEGFEGAADGELVVGGEAAFGGEIEDEGVDRGSHGFRVRQEGGVGNAECGSGREEPGTRDLSLGPSGRGGRDGIWNGGLWKGARPFKGGDGSVFVWHGRMDYAGAGGEAILWLGRTVCRGGGGPWKGRGVEPPTPRRGAATWEGRLATGTVTPLVGSWVAGGRRGEWRR